MYHSGFYKRETCPSLPPAGWAIFVCDGDLMQEAKFVPLDHCQPCIIYPWCWKGQLNARTSQQLQGCLLSAFAKSNMPQLSWRRISVSDNGGQYSPAYTNAYNYIHTYVHINVSTNSILAMGRHRPLPAYKESVLRVHQLLKVVSAKYVAQTILFSAIPLS